MRRFFATTCNTNVISAAALGLLLAPLAANSAAAAAEPPNPISAPPIEIEDRTPDDAGPCAQFGDACAADPDADDSSLAKERAYLVETAHPGGTMLRQGPEVAIGRLNPEFATRLAAAIREARESGLTAAGVFSAYRPPAFGVGGFSDKFNSLHAYGLAVDMHGIGRPGSTQAKLWHTIAAKHGVVCPYGVNNRAEWNHCQPTRIKVIRADNPLRKTIKAEGPLTPFGMFEAGKALIESVASLSSSVIHTIATTSLTARVGRTARSRRVRTADMGTARQRRQVRVARHRGSKSMTAAVRTTGRVTRHAAARRATGPRARANSS